MADSLERLALAMRAQALIHRERGRHNRAKELEAFAFAVETAAALDRATFAPFSAACHELGDRAQVIQRANPGLRPHELHMLRMLAAGCHAVGDDAECAPDLYTETPA